MSRLSSLNSASISLIFASIVSKISDRYIWLEPGWAGAGWAVSSGRHTLRLELSLAWLHILAIIYVQDCDESDKQWLRVSSSFKFVTQRSQESSLLPQALREKKTKSEGEIRDGWWLILMSEILSTKISHQRISPSRIFVSHRAWVGCQESRSYRHRIFTQNIYVLNIW